MRGISAAGSHAFFGADRIVKGDVSQSNIRNQPDAEETHGKHIKDQPTQEGQIQHKKLPFVAVGLFFAQVDGLQKR